MRPDERILPETIRRCLFTPLLGSRIYYYPAVDSTNRVARELAAAGEPEGTLVITDFQTAGRGRRDHTWSSAEGRDLLFSLILRAGGEPRMLLPITLAFSLALSVGLSKTFGSITGSDTPGVDVGIKWPNDLFAGGAKIGGILAEGSSVEGRATYTVVGVGINVNSTTDDFPEEISASAASCATLTGMSLDRAALLAELLGSMESYYRRFCVDGFGPLAAAYVDRMIAVGKQVEVDIDGAGVALEVIGVGVDGALLTRRSDTGEALSLYNEEIRIIS